jgi:transposase
MRRVREVLRLQASGVAERQIAASVGVGKSTVHDMVRRARAAGLAMPQAATLTDEALNGSNIVMRTRLRRS